MSEKTWTDEQLHTYLSALDVSKLDFMYSSGPGRFEWEWNYHLIYQGENIRLTLTQGQMIERWIQDHRYPPQTTKESEQNTERDTHFAGFAKLVGEDIASNMGIIFDVAYKPEEEYIDAICQIIARRAYDLAFHTLMNTSPAWLDVLDPSEWVGRIPDMTAWPEESK